jgi:predicted RNA-binding protein with PUA domain
VKNYIGGNGLIEMAFAHVLNKKIFLINQVPKMNYRDEIEAMKPVILDGNLSMLE